MNLKSELLLIIKDGGSNNSTSLEK
jgi:hypothetical protein